MLKRILRGAIFAAAICAITSLFAIQANAHGHGGVAIGVGVGGPAYWGPGCGYGPYYVPHYIAPAPYYAYPAPYYAVPAYYPAATYYPAPGGVIVGP